MSDYIITDGKRYIGLDNYKKLTAYLSKSRAKRFALDKANNLIANSIPKSLNGNWQVQLYKKAKPQTQEVQEPTISTSESEWIERLLNIPQSKAKLIEERNKLCEQWSYVDKELSDVYHFIKENSPPAHIRTKIYKIEQDILKKREDIKKRINYIQVLMKALDKRLIIGEIHKQLKEFSYKPYKNRTEVYNQLTAML